MILWKWRLIWALIVMIGGLLMFAAYFLSVIMLAGFATQARAETVGGCVQPGTQKQVPVSSGTKDGADQIANAKSIDQAAQKAGLSGYASRVAIIAAMGESTLINLDYGDQVNGVRNPDGSLATSFGLFQQQTSQGWGTKEQVMDPEYAATSFFLGQKHDGAGGLVSIENWESDTWISNVIHKVQGNSVADHYTKSIPEADQIISAADIDINRPGTRSGSTGADAGGDTGAGKGDTAVKVSDPGKPGCGGAEGGVTVGDVTGKWVNPLPGSTITSGYGPRATPAGTADFGAFHYGLDMSSSAAGASVLAVTDMKITIASDTDGGTGAGTHVKGQSVDGQLSFAMYHMEPGSLKVKVGDTVAAGSPVGTEGASGNVTGRHLHLEIFKGAIPDPWFSTAPVTDPCPVLESKLSGFSCQTGSPQGGPVAVPDPGVFRLETNVVALGAPTSGGQAPVTGAACGCGCTGPRYKRLAA